MKQFRYNLFSIVRSGSKWAHVSCALWIPEVNIGCPEKMEPINKISNIPVSTQNYMQNKCENINEI